jgi:E3 ubiquitin-protein ligase HUWE1
MPLLTSRHSFNQMDLPEYNTYEQLHQMLLLAITEGTEGFGFA